MSNYRIPTKTIGGGNWGDPEYHVSWEIIKLVSITLFWAALNLASASLIISVFTVIYAYLKWSDWSSGDRFMVRAQAIDGLWLFILDKFKLGDEKFRDEIAGEINSYKEKYKIIIKKKRWKMWQILIAFSIGWIGIIANLLENSL